MADAWDAWLSKYASGQVEQPAQPTSPLAALFGALMPNKGTGGAGPGQVPTPNKQGLYTPGISMAAAGPPNPIDYSRMRALLGSGVLTNGGVVDDPGPTAQAAPAPAPEPQKKSWLEKILGGFGR